MDLITKIKQVEKLSLTAPVLVIDCPKEALGEATVLDASIPSKSLGIVNTATGLKMPAWFEGIVNGKSRHRIVIDSIDSIDKESQEKFYELLKYKAISDVELPNDCTIIVTAKSLQNVSESIVRLCVLVK